MQTDFFRCTVLTDRLLRLEFSPNSNFDDRATQVFWQRAHGVPDYVVWDDAKKLDIKTKNLQLSCTKGSIKMIKRSLMIKVQDTNATWQLGDDNELNLMGTARTLDESDGRIQLEKGLISRSGWAVVDDTRSLAIEQDGELYPRDMDLEYQDIYFFGHGLDYKQALKDFSLVAGKAPLIPRWALGNWWSRYWAYSAEELLLLMNEFKERRIPLSVCVIDMDWHITETGNDSSGWTGYTWNRDLFPDPQSFLGSLHQMGLKTTMNLHPADGIYPHEDQYQRMCEATGMDPVSENPVKFDLSNPDFTAAYFPILHHPLENMGVDFWWIDWQQGSESEFDGLDPLWWLNHHHYYDNLNRKPGPGLIFSRYGGLGSHRYPIGFSGDTIVNWGSLAYQPYFTATSANVNYGWWSHDIGGHMHGIKDPELFIRWVQFGVFSPIFRLHSSNQPEQERRPWGYGGEVEKITREYMRLRHRLIPYLYTMVYRSHQDDLPLVLPLYYEWPDEEKSCQYADQYLFGSELLVAPFLGPRDKKTQLCEKEIWLPDGTWFDFFNGTEYSGNTVDVIKGDLSQIPVFARAGAIVPLACEGDVFGTGNPSSLDIVLFPGRDNQFVLIEDNGEDLVSEIMISQLFSKESWQIEIHPAVGEIDHLPKQREVLLVLRGIENEALFSGSINGEWVDLKSSYNDSKNCMNLSGLTLSPKDYAIVIVKL